LNKANSRYAKPCPACGAIIHPFDVHLDGDSFPCPSCGEWLKSDRKYAYTICAVSLLASGVLTFHLGYRNEMFILITIGATLVLSTAGVFLNGLIVPPVYKKVGGKGFDKLPSLFADEKHSEDKEIKP